MDDKRQPVSVPLFTIRAAVAAALAEDLTPLGDLSAALLPPDALAQAEFVVRVDGVVAGLACVDETFSQVDPAIICDWAVGDGAVVSAGQLARLECLPGRQGTGQYWRGWGR